MNLPSKCSTRERNLAPEACGAIIPLRSKKWTIKFDDQSRNTSANTTNTKLPTGTENGFTSPPANVQHATRFRACRFCAGILFHYTENIQPYPPPVSVIRGMHAKRAMFSRAGERAVERAVKRAVERAGERAGETQ